MFYSSEASQGRRASPQQGAELMDGGGEEEPCTPQPLIVSSTIQSVTFLSSLMWSQGREG